MASATDTASEAAATASTASESFVLADPAATTTLPREDDVDDVDEDDEDPSDLDSLPSISTSVLSPSDVGSDSDFGGISEAQREWEASLEQLQLMLTLVLVPFAGKFLGRKFAYWSWARYMEWAHDVEVRWTSKKAFNAAGVVGAAATL